jgi:hypothetical protein
MQRYDHEAGQMVETKPMEMKAHSSQMKHKGLVSMSAHDLQRAKQMQHEDHFLNNREGDLYE